MSIDFGSIECGFTANQDYKYLEKYRVLDSELRPAEYYSAMVRLRNNPYKLEAAVRPIFLSSITRTKTAKHLAGLAICDIDLLPSEDYTAKIVDGYWTNVRQEFMVRGTIVTGEKVQVEPASCYLIPYATQLDYDLRQLLDAANSPNNPTTPPDPLAP